jgi:hypothetical protein
MKSALLTLHVKPRIQWGWHYHGHCIIEWQDGVDTVAAAESLEKIWHRAAKEESGREKAMFRRMVCGSGDALGTGGFGGQGEMWAEPPGAVQRVLQYAVRDVVQGCEDWVTGLCEEAAIATFADLIAHSKLHRTFGEWRKSATKEVDLEASTVTEGCTIKIEEGEKKVTQVWHLMGSLETVWDEARSGNQKSLTALRTLTARYFNRGKLCRRLTIVVNSVSELRRAG